MKTVLTTFLCLSFFMLGWTIGVTIERNSTDFTNCYVLWFIVIVLVMWRVKIKDKIEL